MANDAEEQILELGVGFDHDDRLTADDDCRLRYDVLDGKLCISVLLDLRHERIWVSAVNYETLGFICDHATSKPDIYGGLFFVSGEHPNVDSGLLEAL